MKQWIKSILGRVRSKQAGEKGLGMQGHGDAGAGKILWPGEEKEIGSGKMYIIVGLGNPGREYENTRHNVGWLVLDRLAAEGGIDILEKKHKALVGKGVIDGQKVLLAKPLTYMNLSGESVRELVDYYKIDMAAELIVISDDIALAPGQLRVRKKGSAGGHNGLKNIIQNLGSDEFIRLRMGVGDKPTAYDLKDFVLGHLVGDEKKLMDEAAKRGADCIRMIMAQGPDAAMNAFNAKKEKKKPSTEDEKAQSDEAAQPNKE